MTIKIEATIDAITNSQTLEEVIKRLPALFHEFVENERKRPAEHSLFKLPRFP